MSAAADPTTLDEAIAALDEQLDDGKHELLEPKHTHLGPAVIGTKQYEANKRLAKMTNQHLGPLAIMTDEEAVAWFKADKPRAWQGWLESYRMEQKALAAKEQQPVGLKGERRGKGKGDGSDE